MLTNGIMPGPKASSTKTRIETHEHVRLSSMAYRVQKQVPRKQGLKPVVLAYLPRSHAIGPKASSTKTRIETRFRSDPVDALAECPKASSTKTRIETLDSSAIYEYCHDVQKQVPRKQGLKPTPMILISASTSVQKQVPRKQGLKPRLACRVCCHALVQKQVPRKQGLKLIVISLASGAMSPKASSTKTRIETIRHAIASLSLS